MTVGIALLSGASTYLFYKIDKHAGLMMVPCCLWAHFYVALTHQMWKLGA